MKSLIEGILEFREQRLPELQQRFRELAGGQSPDTLFISCSDSRVVPSLLLSTDPGELFVMRNVGNLLPPCTLEGISTGDLSEASALEYAVHVLKVETIIICGHSGCGAMEAVLAGKQLADTPNLASWLTHAETAAERLRDGASLDSSLPPADQLSQLNVLLQLEHLVSYPFVCDRLADGSLQIGGWWFDISKGEMSAYDQDLDRFVLIDRATAGSSLIERFSRTRSNCGCSGDTP